MTEYKNEVWKDIRGFEGIYQVSNFGRVRSLDRAGINGQPVKGRLLASSITVDGRVKYNMFKDGHMYCKCSHRLTAEAFISNPEGLPFVANIDGDRTDNHVSNLEWTNKKEFGRKKSLFRYLYY